MRRAALALALVVVLAGCGDGDGKKRAAPVKETATPSRVDSTEEALEAVRDSSLPEDAKRELEEAAELLDDQP